MLSSSSFKSSNNFLIYSIYDAFLIDLRTLYPKFHLEANKNNNLLKFVSYIPNSNEKILACFTNDIIHIWSGLNFNTIKLFYPVRKRNHYLKYNQDNIKAKLTEFHKISLHNDLHKIIQQNIQIKDTTNGIINSMSLSSDGNYCCLTFIDNYLMIISLYNLEIFKLIQLQDITCQNALFISSQFNEMLILALTTTSNLILIDFNNFKIHCILQNNNIYKFDISKNGEIFYVILMTGELNVYKTSIIINQFKEKGNFLNTIDNPIHQIHCQSIKKSEDDNKTADSEVNMFYLILIFICS